MICYTYLNITLYCAVLLPAWTSLVSWVCFTSMTQSIPALNGDIVCWISVCSLCTTHQGQYVVFFQELANSYAVGNTSMFWIVWRLSWITPGGKYSWMGVQDESIPYQNEIANNNATQDHPLPGPSNLRNVPTNVILWCGFISSYPQSHNRWEWRSGGTSRKPTKEQVPIAYWD